MSLQFQTPLPSGLSGFWASVKGLRPRRDPPPPPEPRRDPEVRVLRRPAFTAESLADSFIRDLGAGDFVFRDLKDEFDALCEEAEIARISDKRFAMWLQDYGGVRRRRKHAGITTYTFQRRWMKAA
jgi:hypothetical protein